MRHRIEDIELSNVDRPLETDTKVGNICAEPIDAPRGKNDSITVLSVDASQWTRNIRGRPQNKHAGFSNAHLQIQPFGKDRTDFSLRINRPAQFAECANFGIPLLDQLF